MFRALRLIAFVFGIGLLLDWASTNLEAASPIAMAPMEQIGPQSRGVDLKEYAHVIRVGASEAQRTLSGALASIKDASAANRYAILAAAGNYNEARIQMKPHVDLFGGFLPSDWKERDVYGQATILNGQNSGLVVIGADDSRLDGFVITGGRNRGHGAGILCDGVSPTIVNNIIVGNQTLKPQIGDGLGKQIANEGAGLALLNGSRSYVGNNLICENSTEIGAGAGLTARGHVQAKILRNVFCNNVAGSKDDSMFHGKVGSRSSPGAAIACSEASSPQISFNVMVLGAAPINNDAGGIWVEGNSLPPINYNWIVGNLSGDDGGGIYVMGNLYYDAAGVRHDMPPDGSVAIEDNLIAGNDCIRGGPGGVRVSRWGRVDLRRNQIVGNGKGGAHGAEGGVICLMENNVIADNGAKREPAKPTFRVTADITGRNFDAGHYATQFAINHDFRKEDLAGSAIRIGKQWSVVKSNTARGLVVWGKITDEAAKLEVLDHYLTTK